MSRNNGPIRILHVLATTDRGGAETWIVYLMRRIDRSTFQFDFCVETDRPCAYDDEIRALGGKIMTVYRKRYHGLARYSRRLGTILREGGYDIVHAHSYDAAGFSLRVAARVGVAHRFAHLHTTSDGCPSTPTRIVYRKVMRRVIGRYATCGLGCSRGALENYFGPGWVNDARMRVVYYGVDLAPFEQPTDRSGVRAELGLPPQTPLIIHAGSFVGAKNHRKLIDVFSAVRARRPDLHLLLLGKGELEAQVRRQVSECNLTDCVHFLGVRSDVPRFMKAADMMLMPSVREGMPVVMLEATAAGLPIVISDLPGMREANEICCNGKLLSVDLSTEKWADAVIEALEAPRPDPEESLDRVRQSPFSSERSARDMEQVYRDAVASREG